MLKLLKPLVPGDSMQLNFNYEIAYKGFENENMQTAVVHNGTFFNSSFFPSFGYNAEMEITDADDRKKKICQQNVVMPFPIHQNTIIPTLVMMPIGLILKQQ